MLNTFKALTFPVKICFKLLNIFSEKFQIYREVGFCNKHLYTLTIYTLRLLTYYSVCFITYLSISFFGYIFKQAEDISKFYS